ncbi:MAG: beta-galactosidase [Lentisphaeria bacterium]|nr:beta-galactosidase [Lentisphaeria bacterium]
MIPKKFLCPAVFALALALPAADLLLDAPGKQVDVSDLVAVEPNKRYEFLCEASGGSGKLRAVLHQFDRNRTRIAFHNVSGAPETYTVLARPAVRGEKSVVVSDASKWDFPRKGKLLALDAAKDGSDLPNRKLCFYITAVEKTAEGYRVEFDRPLRFARPAGCGVRLHRDGGPLGCQAALPLTSPMKKHLESADSGAALPARLWQKAAFVKIALSTDSKEPVRVTKCSFLPVEAKKAEAAPKSAPAAPVAEQSMTPYGYEKVLKKTADEIVFTNHFFTSRGKRVYWSGTALRGLDLPASSVGQFEFDLKSDVSCHVRVMFILKKSDGKTLYVTTPTRTVIPDGNYRRYLFFPQEQAQWDKTAVVTGWTIRIVDYRENGRIMGIRDPRLLPRKNLFPGAQSVKAGEKTLLHEMRPLGKYRFTWEDGSCPGVKITFFNHLMEELPGTAVTLGKGEKSVDFTAPEMMIYAAAVCEGPVEGRPQLDCLRYVMRYKPEVFWKGRWIWSRFGKGPDYAYVWFERTFELADKPEYAVLGLMADDKSEIFVNGERVGATFRYSIPDRFTITDHLKKGENKLTVRVYNLDSAAGLCADLYWKNVDGQEGYVLTDKKWLCHENGRSGEKPAAISSPVVELGDPANTAPWSAYIGFVYVGPRGRFTLLSSENGRFTAKLDRPVISLFRTLLFERRTASGKKTKLLLPAGMTKNADGTVTVTYPKILPVAEPSKTYLVDDFWEIAGGRALAELPARIVEPTEFQKAEFVGIGGRTMLKFRGKLWNPAFYLNRGPERREAIQRIGVHSYSVSCELVDIWQGLGRYDFKKLDTALELLATIDPEAIFILDVGLYMPEWWLEAYPEEASAYFEGTRRNTYDDVQALASKRWLTDALVPVKAIFDHIRRTGYADRIWAFNLTNGRGSEWFWGGASAGTDFYRKKAHPGFSPADYKTFWAMLKERYKTDEALARAWNMPGVTIGGAKMPDPRQRTKGAAGSLFDPTKDAQLMDWCRFRNESLAEAINFFGRSFKNLTGNGPLVGCYYGYWTELAASAYRSQLITGHNGFMTCLRSDAVDFFRAPSSYGFRRPGDTNGLMHPFTSFISHGKVVFIENDERTAYSPSQGDSVDVYVGRPSTPIESVGQINREFGMACAAGVAHYWYENPPGSFYEPAIVAVLAEQYKAFAALPPVRGLTPVETAVVGDVESIYYSADGVNGIFPPAIKGLFRDFNRLGIPYHSIVLDDLFDKGRIPAHKLYVMLPTLVLTKEQRRALAERFAKEKATVLWLYSAGSSYPDKGPSGDNCGDFLGLKFTMETDVQTRELLWGKEKFESQFTGSPLFIPVSGWDSVLARDDRGRPAAVVKKLDGAVHVFSVFPDVPKTLLAKIVETAGVFRYVKTLDDPLWIGNDLVTLHAARSGKKQIFLPRGKALKPILGPMKKTVRSGEAWEAVAGQSYVFLVTD